MRRGMPLLKWRTAFDCETELCSLSQGGFGELKSWVLRDLSTQSFKTTVGRLPRWHGRITRINKFMPMVRNVGHHGPGEVAGSRDSLEPHFKMCNPEHEIVINENRCLHQKKEKRKFI
ncbi:unnamed protein product [Timema podura]|uniref:Uncharacterized protein n=1 Tax=Timema podura TaxID=61482 RepID=A0ABN7NL99_TIMPD|nr:unnamed protein product [Timema podura]